MYPKGNDYMKKLCTVVVSALLLGSLAGCSSEPNVDKPKFFGADCLKIESRVQDSAQVTKSLYEFSISGEQARAGYSEVLRYFRSYEKARAKSLTRDQKRFLKEQKKSINFNIDWIDYFMEDATATQWAALGLISDLQFKRATYPCSTMTYDELEKLPMDQPVR
jgi:hypothetical protein